MVMLSRTRIAEAQLSPHERASIAQWCASLLEDPYGEDAAAYDESVHVQLHALPAHLTDLVRSFGERLGAAGVLRVRGLPVPETMPPTPPVPYFEVRKRIGTEPLMIAVSLLIGRAVALQAWRGGDRVHNIYPIPLDAETQKASNSVRLAMHTEVAFRPHPPDALVLMCLRSGAAPPSTGFSDLHCLWDALDPSGRQLLRDPEFGFPGVDARGEPIIFEPKPVAIPTQGRHRFEFDTGVTSASRPHQAALKALHAKIEQTATEVTLQAGDLILIDNLHMVHGRTQFSPGYAGGDRWLQRCLVKRH